MEFISATWEEITTYVPAQVMGEDGSRDRLIAALEHREPDRVPLDLGAGNVTSIVKEAYDGLRKALDLPPASFEAWADELQQLPVLEEDLLAALGVDTRSLYPVNYSNDGVGERLTDAGEYYEYKSEFGILWRYPKDAANAHWFDVVGFPLSDVGATLTNADVDALDWPDPQDERRFAGMSEAAQLYHAAGKAVALRSISAGIFEMALRLRGYDNFYMDLALNKSAAAYLMGRITDYKIAYYEKVLPLIGEYVDVVLEGDDLGSQEGLLVSPDMYREMVRPFHERLFGFLRSWKGPRGFLFYHSDGAIREIIPDLIDLGVDALNPVQFTATGMDLSALKADFGADMAFWGAGVDTQKTLPFGSPGDVREEVKRNMDILMPGGGFIFNTVHNIQKECPVENILAMYETLEEFGRYA